MGCRPEPPCVVTDILKRDSIVIGHLFNLVERSIPIHVTGLASTVADQNKFSFKYYMH